MFIIILLTGEVVRDSLYEIVSFVTRFEAIEYAKTAGFKGFLITN